MALQTLYNFSLNLNNCLSISIMKDTESKYQKIFAFLNMIPGVKKEDGTRSYDFKGGINYKLQLTKLYEISTVINAYMRGQMKMVGPYGIINDSSKSSYGNSSGVKSLYFNYSQADEEKNKGVPGIFLVGKSGNITVSTMIPAPAAFTTAETCSILYKKGIEWDIEEFKNNPPVNRGENFGNGGSSVPKKASQPSGGSESGFTSFSTDDAPF